jgi:hypothetical protein
VTGHLLRDDLRGPLLPIDGLSHISRINDWEGSDSWVEGCRKDKSMPEGPVEYPEPKLPFKLLTKSYHEGAMRNPGEVVYIQPSKRGAQHAKIPGQQYPDLPDPVSVGTEGGPRLQNEQTHLLGLVTALDSRVRDLELWRNAMSQPATKPPEKRPDDLERLETLPGSTPVTFGAAPVQPAKPPVNDD